MAEGGWTSSDSDLDISDVVDLISNLSMSDHSEPDTGGAEGGPSPEKDPAPAVEEVPAAGAEADLGAAGVVVLEDAEFVDALEEFEDEDDDDDIKCWHDLPSELKLRIISFCKGDVVARKAILRVCREWRLLGFDSSLWKHDDVLTFGEQVPAELMCDAVIAFASVLRSLSVSLSDGLAALLETIVKRGIPIKNLTVTPTRQAMTVQELVWMTELVKSLETLSLKGISNPKTPSVILTSGYSFVPLRLRSLDLSQMKNLDDDAVATIADKCPNLEHLDLDFDEYLTDQSLNVIADKLSKLQALFIDGERNTDAAFANLLKKLSHLKAFGVSYAREMSNKTFLLLSKMTQLRYLKVRHGERLSGDVIAECFGTAKRGFRDLKTLNLQFCDALGDDGVIAIALACPNLEWFISEFGNPGDKGINALVENCRNLKVLYIIGGHLVTGRTWMPKLAYNLRNLQYVECTMCVSLSSGHIQEAALQNPKAIFVDNYGNVVERTLPNPRPTNTFMEVLTTNPDLNIVERNIVLMPNLLKSVSEILAPTRVNPTQGTFVPRSYV